MELHTTKPTKKELTERINKLTLTLRDAIEDNKDFTLFCVVSDGDASKNIHLSNGLSLSELHTMFLANTILSFEQHSNAKFSDREAGDLINLMLTEAGESAKKILKLNEAQEAFKKIVNANSTNKT